MIANNTRSLLRKEFICVVFLIVVLQLTLVRVGGYSGSQIGIPLLTKPVTIDGQWTSADEWSDALVIPLINCDSLAGCSPASNVTASGYLYVKHDPSNFYFLIDFASSNVMDVTYDGMSVILDPLHNEGTVAQSDDREVVAFPNGGSMSVGTEVQGQAWSTNNPLPQGVKVAYSMASSSNQAQPHEIAEFLIPYSIFSGMQNTIGFSAVARHGNFGPQFSLAIWPANRLRDNPSTWGELTISPTPIPEFPQAWLIIDLTLLVSLTLTWSRRRGSLRLV